MEVLVLDGKNYVKASKAARDLGYASDYVGQLCRTGQVDSHLIGRTWYVNKEQLGTHRVEKKRMSRAKAREQAKKLIVAHRSKSISSGSKDGARNIAISYESDEGPLIPETRKLEIASEHPRYLDRAEKDESPDTVIENEGNKIILSGDLDVVDVTDGPVGDDTVILTPKVLRSRHETEKVPTKKVLHDITPVVAESEAEAEVAEREPVPQRVRFEERLREPENDDDTALSNALGTTEESVQPTQPSGNVENNSFFMYLLVQLLILVAVLATLPLRSVLTYDTARVEAFESRWLFSIPDTLTKLSELF